MQQVAGLISDIPTCPLTQYCSPQMAHMALPPDILSPRKERRGAIQVPSFKSKGYSHYQAEDVPPEPGSRCWASDMQQESQTTLLALKKIPQGSSPHALRMAQASPRVLGMKLPCSLETLRGFFGVTAKLDQQRKKRKKGWAMSWQTDPAEGEAGRQASVSLQRSWKWQEFSSSDSVPDNHNLHRGWRDINCK